MIMGGAFFFCSDAAARICPGVEILQNVRPWSVWRKTVLRSDDQAILQPVLPKKDRCAWACLFNGCFMKALQLNEYFFWWRDSNSFLLVKYLSFT